MASLLPNDVNAASRPVRGGRYEWTMTWLFFGCFGFVFLDRLAVSFLLPLITSDLKINNQQVGYIGLVTTGAYAISAIVFGALSDRSGKRKAWLIPFVLITGIFSGAGVFVHSFPQLLLVRGIVGIGEGPLWPLMMAMLSNVSSENRFGRNSGITNVGVGVIAVTLGPIFITQLVQFASWQMTFLLSSIPTFIICALMIIFIKEQPFQVARDKVKGAGLAGLGAIAELLKIRNVIICMLICIGSMAGYWTLMLFAPLYLTEVAHVSVAKMGLISSLMGILYIAYSYAVPRLSDSWGRKPILIIFYVLCTIAPLAMFLFRGSSSSVILYVIFGGVPGAMSPLFMILIPMETVPDRLKATAQGLIMGTGEFIGGALFPVFAGYIADKQGLPFMMGIAAIMLAIDVLLGFTLVETHRRKKRAVAAVA